MITNKQPLVVCKRCGNKAPADSFILDHLHRMIVCPDCAKEHGKGAVTPVVLEEKKEPAKPPGWDSEDDYLEKVYKQRKGLSNLNFERIDYENGRYTCFRCKHRFVYNISKKYPRVCPNCGTNVELRV